MVRGGSAVRDVTGKQSRAISLRRPLPDGLGHRLDRNAMRRRFWGGGVCPLPLYMVGVFV